MITILVDLFYCNEVELYEFLFSIEFFQKCFTSIKFNRLDNSNFYELHISVHKRLNYSLLTHSSLLKLLDIETYLLLISMFSYFVHIFCPLFLFSIIYVTSKNISKCRSYINMKTKQFLIQLMNKLNNLLSNRTS